MDVRNEGRRPSPHPIGGGDMLNQSYTHLVSYRRDEDDPTSTNIVHATSLANIDREFADCA